MPGPFDGVASTLNDVFGDAVLVHPQNNGAPYSVTAVFRRQPVQVLTDEGSTLLAAESYLKIPKDLVGPLSVGDAIEPEPGTRFELIAKHFSGSPGEDAFLVFELERLD